MEIVIITGISGSGKSKAVNALEDIGYFCIDNMPPQLISKFCDIARLSDIDKVAFVIDIRGGALFVNLEDEMEKLKKSGITVKLLYLDTDLNEIKNRYKETRRKHPLLTEAGNDLDKALAQELTIIKPLRKKANFTLDTTLLSTAKLRESVVKYFVDDIKHLIFVNCMSFGYKHGVPSEADLIFDVRFLANPFYVPELKDLTGLSEKVQNFVMADEKSKIYYNKISDMLDFLLPQYLEEGKTQLVIAFGCTGGRHRSVTYAELFSAFIRERNFKVDTYHRDINK